MARDSESLAREIDGYRATLTAVARSRGLDHHAAEDCVQDVALRAMSMTFTRDDLEPLLKCMVRNRAVDILRSTQSREARQRLVGSRTLVEQSDPFAPVHDQAEARWLMRRMTNLRPRERQLAELVAQGLEVQQAGQLLGLTPKNTSVTWSRAAAAMRALVASASAVVVWARRHGRQGTASTLVAASAITLLTMPHVVLPSPPGAADRPPLNTAGQLLLHNEPSAPVIVLAVGSAKRSPALRPPVAAKAGTRGASSAQDSIALIPRVDGELAGTRGPVTTERRREDESFQESLMRCVEKGLVITVSYQGCAG